METELSGHGMRNDCRIHEEGSACLKKRLGWSVVMIVVVFTAALSQQSLFAQSNAGSAQTSTSAQSSGGSAQSNAAPDVLYKTIQSLDTKFFDAYNHCDMATISSMVADDLEFYHDKSGLERGKQSLVDGLKKYICGKVTRELVPGSLEVYPLAGYGAVEIGVHRFHHPVNESEGVGEAKFIHLWQNKDGVWKITRVISFDHAAAKGQ